MSSAAITREIALTYALACALTAVVAHVGGPFMASYGHTLLACGFLLLALSMARRHGRSAADYGIDLAGLLEAHPDEPEAGSLLRALRRGLPRLLSELGFALRVALVFFPPFVLGFHVWHDVRHPFTFHPPPAPLDFALTHLIAIALPEEALFRGFFQTRLGDLSARRVRILGAQLSPLAVLVQAALFAFLHYLVGFSPQRLATFFPGLLFAWMRERRGGIGAAVWFHALCNVLAELLTRGYL